MHERHVERLIRRAQQGSADAFARLYDEYADRVHAFVRSRVRDAEDAKDLTATVFMRAWEALPSYDQRGIPFSAWLFRIARNAVIDEYRRRGKEPVRVDIDEAQSVRDAVDVDESAIAACEAESVRRAIGALTDEQAAVIVMRFLWDMPVSAVAQALGKTEGAVKTMQHRAVRALARRLMEMQDDDA